MRRHIQGWLAGVLLCLPFGFVRAGQTAFDTVPVSLYRFDTVSNQSKSDGFDKAFDGDSSTWWALNTAAGDPCPVFAIISLTDTHNLCGVYYLPNGQNSADKLSGYEIYVSADSAQWGEPEAAGRIYWEGAVYPESSSDVAGKYLTFGAVKGRYLKIVYLGNTNTWNYAIQTAELRLLEDVSAVAFKKNQRLDVSAVPSVLNALEPAPLYATATSGLSVDFRVVSGPAQIENREGEAVLKGTGEEGLVVLEAYQEGDSVYYPVTQRFAVRLENPSVYKVKLYTPITEAEPLVMPCDTLSYMLQARAEIGSQFNTVSKVYFTVDGKRLETRFDARTGLAQAVFHPGSYGEFNIDIHASASNGSDTVVTRNITVDSAEDTRTVRTFDAMLINFPDPGQTNGGTFVFPQHQGSYWRIMAKLDIKCPDIPGACDDWDRGAWVEVQTPDGQWREIIRYITSYGKACYHELDVTDFASLLQGELPMRMYIETWGTGGYSVTLDFEFSKGIPQYLYTTATPLWRGNFPFGDMANLQPLDTLTVNVDKNATALNLKVVTTGHGWGNNNTANAAEFYHARHHLYVDDEEFEQDLWRTCNPNPDGCSPQAGTWTYDRAGWCPGAISPGDNFNATAHRGKSQLILKYILQENYRDYCHPHNPECISGRTCRDCDDTFNPQYYIAGWLISYFNKMYDTCPYTDGSANEQINAVRDPLKFNIYPNPASSRVFVQPEGETGPGSLQILGVGGQVHLSRVFRSAAELSALELNVENLPAGIYFVRVATRYRSGVRKVVVK